LRNAIRNPFQRDPCVSSCQIAGSTIEAFDSAPALQFTLKDPFYLALAINFPVTVLMRTHSPGDMYSGT
jgi:hypothetical protein